ncbi:Phage head morphogenesis domain [uncultured Caudovirales phage]|uniref:Phage head morphogenesis domain n=1 Tax=uncultured Caudovirales phage TaxID=2100421 RepID=A0A6J5S366_9CAUD|nr:Phage head morphogenesis domain [uncultured Caudovirales phage]CAB4182982.1 Phage head morphogenesis domain [uncultured Caudovirales phage]CAB4200067.1 Phage head morphogenesis domain [uncultured Caudovirales phage]CAB4213583.1 Phage head morphogenesis domain [uncultured Caudovirales phage]CAB4218574.1 Phage head morphogenesis domain [uncultured Caudovirales phage]
MKRLRGVYGDLNFVTKQEIQRLERKIKQQEDNGVPRTVVQEQTLLSLQQTIADIQKALTDIAPAAQSVIEEGREKIVRTANDGSSNVVTSLLPDGVETEAVFSRLNEGQVQALVASLDSGPLADTLASMPNNVGQSLAGFLTNNAVRQTNPRQLAREFYKRYQDVSRQRVEVIARTELIRSAREAQRDVYKQNDIVMGYERQAAQDGRVCLGCLVLSGKVYSKDEIMPSHPMCRCVMIPVVPDSAWFSANTSNPIPKFTAAGPQELMAGMTDDEIRSVFGPTRYQKYKAGEVTLDSLIGVNNNPKWGPQVTIKPLRDVDGSVTLPPDGPLHKPVRRPDLNKPKPNKPVPVPVPPVTPPAPKPKPPVAPPVVPPITPPTPPVPPKRKPGRPPKPKPPVTPPAPKPVPVPKPPKPPKPAPTPKPPKAPPAPKPPVVTQPTATGKPTPQSKRLRKATLGRQSAKNPYRFWDPNVNRYVIDGGKFMGDFRPKADAINLQVQKITQQGMADYRDYEDTKDAIRQEYAAGKITQEEFYRRNAEVRDNYLLRRDELDEKKKALKESFKSEVYQALKADTPFNSGPERITIRDTKGGQGNDAKIVSRNLKQYFEMVEDRPIRPCDIHAGPLPKGNSPNTGGWHTDSYGSRSESRIRAKWNVGEDPLFMAKQVAWHEITHHLHNNTDNARPRQGDAWSASVALWNDITAKWTPQKTWCGRAFAEFGTITRDYGGRIYDHEKAPRGEGLEMITTMSEALHDNPLEMFGEPSRERIAQFYVEYIL